MYTYKILQNWTRELFHSSVIQFEKKSYLFNCSDGSQRNFMEQKMKFPKVTDVFYNSGNLENMLGSFGFSLSRSEQIGQIDTPFSKNLSIEKNKSNRLKYWGPPGFKNNFLNCDNFIFNVMKYIIEFDQNEGCFKDFTGKKIKFFEDENITIFPICVNYNEKNEKTNSDMESDINFTSNKNDFAISYICEPKRLKGKLNIEKLKSLGLKPGPDYTKLHNGEDIIFNNMEIKSKDVLLKELPSAIVMLLYSPTELHARKLIDNNGIKPYFSENLNTQDKIISVIVHILGDINILGTDFYQDFINKFGTDVIHIIDCPNTNRLYMLNEKKTMLKYLLNKLNNKLFINDNFTENDTIPSINLDIFLSNYEIQNNKVNMSQMHRIITSKPGFEYKLRPFDKRGIISDSIFPEPYYYKNDIFKEFQIKIDKIINSNIQDFSSKQDNKTTIFKNEPELIFFGTVSQKPLSYRNVSSIMVKLSNNYNLLLDCGEGTFTQILSYYGHINTDEVLKNIKIIFITHQHGDHHTGLMKILIEIDKLKNKRKAKLILSDFNDLIYVIAPTTILKWISNSINSDLIYKEHIILIDNKEINPNLNMVYDKFLLKQNALESFVDVELENYEKIEEKYNNFTNLIRKGNSKSKILDFYSNLSKYLGIELFSIEVKIVNFRYFIVMSLMELS